jgi:hypothetical protein
MDPKRIIFSILAGLLSMLFIYLMSDEYKEKKKIREQERQLAERERRAMMRARLLDIERAEKLLEEESKKV